MGRKTHRDEKDINNHDYSMYGFVRIHVYKTGSEIVAYAGFGESPGCDTSRKDDRQDGRKRSG